MNQPRTATGTVGSLWRYPVKSMLGEELNSSYVTERGLVISSAATIDEAKLNEFMTYC